MTFRLGEWLVEPSLNRLSRPGESVRLEPRVMELLVLLAGRPNEVLTKEEIQDHLWPQTFVSESSVFRHVSELRRALGDDRKQPRYLETIPKKGYRLIPERLEVQESAETGSSEPTALRFSVSWAAVSVLALVAAALFLRSIDRPARPRPSVDAATRDAYLRGEIFENRVDCGSFEQAIDSYREAMLRDVSFVDVYPRLFDALVASAVLGCRPPQPLFSELESLLSFARENGLDETRRTQGKAALTLWRDGDIMTALSGFQRALHAATSTDTEDLSYAVTLVLSGRPEDGLAEARRSLDALPVDLGENWALGSLLYLTGRYEEAIEQFHRTLELYPGYRPAEQLLALSYLLSGDRQRALALAVKAEAEVRPDEPMQRFDAVPGFIFAALGDRDRARRVLDRWTAKAETAWVPKTSLALLHLGLGERDAASRWLEEARKERDPWMVLLTFDPAFQPLSAGSAVPRDEAEANVRFP